MFRCFWFVGGLPNIAGSVSVVHCYVSLFFVCCGGLPSMVCTFLVVDFYVSLFQFVLVTCSVLFVLSLWYIYLCRYFVVACGAFQYVYFLFVVLTG